VILLKNAHSLNTFFSRLLELTLQHLLQLIPSELLEVN